MKKNNLTIKTLLYFTSFSIVILMLLWLIQIQCLEIFYEHYQITNVKNIASLITKNQDDLVNKLDSYAYNNDLCIQYYSSSKVYEYNTKNLGCLLGINNNTIVKSKKILLYSEDKDYIKIYAPNTGKRSIIYLVKLDQDNFVFLNTTLEDINTTSALLKKNLIYIVMIIMALSIIVSVFLAKKINKPILNIISSAKELGKGNYNVKFAKSNIAELDELSEVLTVAASEMNKTEELRRDLLANVSHDLKTPLTMIKAYAEKVRDLSYKDKENAKEI